MIALVLLGGIYQKNKNRNNLKAERYEQLLALVNVGDDIDKSLKILKDNNFKIVQGKIKPTGPSGDFYSAIILLDPSFTSPGLLATLYEVTSWRIFYNDYSPFGIIEANLDGKIYSIK